MLKTLITGLAIAATSPGSAGSAFAQVQGTLTIGGFRTVELSDLDLTDGTPAAVVWDPLPGSIAGMQPYITVAAGAGYNSASKTELGLGADPLSAEMSVLPYAHASGLISGRATPETHEAIFETFADLEGNQGYIARTEFGSGPFTFELAGNSRLVVALDAHTVGSVTRGPDFEEWFRTAVWLIGVLGPAVDRYEVSYSLGSTDGLERETDSDYTLTIAIENKTDQWASGYVEFGGSTISGSLSPIPEPDTLPAYTAGLFVIGLWGWWLRLRGEAA